MATDPRVLAENWAHDNLDPGTYDLEAFRDLVVEAYIAGYYAAWGEPAVRP